METKEVLIAARIPRVLHEALLRAQKNVKKKTGFRLSISELVRRAIELQYAQAEHG